MESINNRSVKAVRLMRLLDRQRGKEMGKASTTKLSDDLKKIAFDCVLNPDISESVKQSIVLSLAKAMNEFMDATVANNVPDMEKFLSGLRALNVPVDRQYEKLRELRKIVDEYTEETRLFEQTRKKNPNYLPTSSEIQKATERSNSLQRAVEDLWADILNLTLTVLAMMVYFKPPNSKELVDAFTAEP